MRIEEFTRGTIHPLRGIVRPGGKGYVLRSLDLNQPGIIQLGEELPENWEKDEDGPFKQIKEGHIKIHGEKLTLVRDLKKSSKILLIAFTVDHPNPKKLPKVIHQEREIPERTYQVSTGYIKAEGDKKTFIQGFALILPNETLIIPTHQSEKDGQWEIQNKRNETRQSWKNIRT